jgi:isoaspartyl peptidase/L-asparaginase-like protein (Ntn-hydrolase superfamily)
LEIVVDFFSVFSEIVHFLSLHVTLLMFSAGYSILQQGGSALDAVEAAVRVMESSKWFNAGKGSTTNDEGFVNAT